jgi:hypothetical protein
VPLTGGSLIEDLVHPSLGGGRRGCHFVSSGRSVGRAGRRAG